MREESKHELRALALAALLASAPIHHALAQSTAAQEDEADGHTEATLPTVTVTADAEKSYKSDSTTVGDKLPAHPRSIPNSVSILTRQQMDDQNLVTTWDALTQITGVQGVSNNLGNSQYHSRGSALEMQVDGTPSATQLSGYHQLDNAMYEQIEVLRGPAGLLQGSGSFAGTVNFTRKRPTRSFSAMGLASTGRWNNHRAELDVAGPLNGDKSLRGRTVLSLVDRDYVFDREHSRTGLWYGTLDYDFNAATRLNVYASFQKHHSTTFSGLPAYTDGSQLSVPRSFNTKPDWGAVKLRTLELGGELTHQFANQWIGTVRAMRRDQYHYFKDGYPSSGVDPATMTVESYTRRQFEYDHVSDSADLFASGPFNLFGRQHTLLLGANWGRFSTSGVGANPASPGSQYLSVPNVRLANPPDVPEPDVTYTTGSHAITTQAGVYGRATFHVTDPLKLIVGARWSNYDHKSRTTPPHPRPTDWARGGRERGVFTPYAGLTYDLSREVTLYGSYADIFVPQTQKYADGNTLPPRTGKQYELGVKTELLDGRLAANLAAFRIRDTNRPLADPAHSGYYLPAGELQSQGWELEVLGRLRPGWEIAAGYTNLRTRWLTGANVGAPAHYWYPRHLYKLWTRYRFGHGPLEGFSVGFGANGMSQAASGASSATVAARAQGAYTVLRLQLAYEVSRRYSITLDVNNLLDTRYYTRLGGLNTYNTFGDPRNVVLTFRARF